MLTITARELSEGLLMDKGLEFVTKGGISILAIVLKILSGTFIGSLLVVPPQPLADLPALHMGVSTECRATLVTYLTLISTPDSAQHTTTSRLSPLAGLPTLHWSVLPT